MEIATVSNNVLIPELRTQNAATEGRIDFEVVSDPERLTEFEARWQQLERAFPKAATYDDYCEAVFSLSATDQLQLVVIRRNDHIVGFAPFVLRSILKKYTIAERRLFSLPAQTSSLIGVDILGDLTPETVAAILQWLMRSTACHLIELCDIMNAGRVHAALTNTVTPDIIWRNRGRKLAVHWVIDLPSSMELYYLQLTSKTRSTLKRKYRKCFEASRGSVTVVTAAQQVEEFLRVAHEISRKTYQWDLGTQLVNDETTRQRLTKSADNRRLRCYVIALDGVPCSFIVGYLVNHVFRYEIAGYDPQYAKDSPSTALLLYVFEDLISNTSCDVFDFGEGGDTSGYKSVFGNRSYSSLTVDVALRTRIYSRFLLALQDGLNRLKNIGSTVLGNNRVTIAFRRRLKKQASPTGSLVRTTEEIVTTKK